VLGDMKDGVQPEQVDQHERGHRHDVGGADGIVDRLDRQALLLLGAPDLRDAGVEDPVDDEARDLVAHDRLLLDRLCQVQHGGHGLLGRVLAAHDLDQRHHRRRIEVVKAHHPVRAQRGIGDLGDRQRRRV
jgi:hypothetical protein